MNHISVTRMSYLETLIEKPAIIIDIGYAYTKCGQFQVFVNWFKKVSLDIQIQIN